MYLVTQDCSPIVKETIIHYEEGMDLINLDLSSMESLLVNAMSREKVLTNLLNDVKKDYEYIDASGQLLNQSGRHIRAVAGNFKNAIDTDYYVEMSMNEIAHLTREKWQTRIEGQLCGSKDRLKVTP